MQTQERLPPHPSRFWLLPVALIFEVPVACGDPSSRTARPEFDGSGGSNYSQDAAAPADGGAVADTSLIVPAKQDASGPDASAPGPEPKLPSTNDPLAGLPTGVTQWKQLCARRFTDPVAEAFCAGAAPPKITSVSDLLRLLKLDFKPGNYKNGEDGNPAFTFTAHSTAITTR